MSPRRTTKPDRRLPPALVRLIEAAEYLAEDAADTQNITEALREFGEMALWVVPIHGVFVSSDQMVSVAIEGTAVRHLGLDKARTEFRKALAAVEPFDRRDAVESAHTHVRTIGEDAYFYAGLAVGITMVTGR
jgi:hypothetical protein